MGHSREKNRSLEAELCHDEGGNQIFMLVTDTGEIREQKFCWDATSPGEPVKFLDCHGHRGNQYWQYDEKVNYWKFCMKYGEICRINVSFGLFPDT